MALDNLDRRLVEELLRDGRTGYAELGRAVGLSASAVTERVRRLEESGVITGYVCEVDAEKLGLPIAALVRLRYPNANYRPFHQLLDTTPEIVEAHHVTGEDCFVLTVRARTSRLLEPTTAPVRAPGRGTPDTEPVRGTALIPARTQVRSAWAGLREGPPGTCRGR
jgi:Lrp/AsnC family leucine-responsive transcriptional regulator